MAMVVAGVAAALAGCGNLPVGGPASTISAPSSSVTTSASLPASEPAPRAGVMPAAALRRALLSAAVLGTAYRTTSSESGDYATAGGLTWADWGDFAGGDSGCRSLFHQHDQMPQAHAYVRMENRAVELREVVESYATVEEAVGLMAANRAEAASCGTLKIRDVDRSVQTYRHSAATKRESVLEYFIHQTYAENQHFSTTLVMVELRAGGEIMHLAYSTSDDNVNPQLAAIGRFVAVAGDYRGAHPRTANRVPPNGTSASELAAP